MCSVRGGDKSFHGSWLLNCSRVRIPVLLQPLQDMRVGNVGALSNFAVQGHSGLQGHCREIWVGHCRDTPGLGTESLQLRIAGRWATGRGEAESL